MRIDFEAKGAKQWVELSELTHKDRKEWIKKAMSMAGKDNPTESMQEMIEFREKFLLDHVKGSSMDIKDLDGLPAEVVDNLLEVLESKMDFTMGLKVLKSLNMLDTREAQ